MLSRQLSAVAILACILGPRSAPAEEVRYYERDGVTYCETRRTVRESVPETRVELRSETVYRGEWGTELRDSTRTCWSPVTEYRWEAFWSGRWNPLVTPHLAYRCVPRTHWEQRTEVVQVPTTCRRLVPETRTARTPVTSWRTVQREVVTLVPLRSGSINASRIPPRETPGMARREQIGGLSRLDNDPPRHGLSTAWRPSTGLVRP